MIDRQERRKAGVPVALSWRRWKKWTKTILEKQECLDSDRDDWKNRSVFLELELEFLELTMVDLVIDLYWRRWDDSIVMMETELDSLLGWINSLSHDMSAIYNFGLEFTAVGSGTCSMGAVY